VGWLGYEGRGDVKSMLFGRATGIRLLFQGHLPGCATGARASNANTCN